MDSLKDAVEGTELACRLGDDFYKFSLKDLSGKPIVIPLRNSTTRQNLIDRLQDAQDELARLEAELAHKLPSLGEARERFSANRCLDFVKAPEVIALPPRLSP